MERHEHQNIAGQDDPGGGSIQGEGDYQSAREYREKVKEFLEHADMAKAAREAAPRNPKEARELEQAEEEGRSHAKGQPVRRMPDAVRSIGTAMRERPMTAIVAAGVLGYLLGRVAHPRHGA